MRLLALACCLALALPARADVQQVQLYILYPTGQNVSIEVSTLADPTNPPEGFTAVPFVVLNGDRCAEHYTLVDGALTYTPPAPPIIPPKADPASAEKAILLDAAITPGGKLSVSRYKSVLETYARDPQSASLEWINVIIPGENISADDAAAVEKHCSDFNMPLRF